LSFHDASLEMEKSWAMEVYEIPTLEFRGKDSIDEHGSFTLDIPSRPCLYHVSPESAMLSALSMHEGYNGFMVLCYKKFGRMVEDVYAYRKHYRFRVCTVALTLHLKLQYTSTIGGEMGMISPMIAAGKKFFPGSIL
jgi:hypothetical protein